MSILSDLNLLKSCFLQLVTFLNLQCNSIMQKAMNKTTQIFQASRLISSQTAICWTLHYSYVAISIFSPWLHRTNLSDLEKLQFHIKFSKAFLFFVLPSLESFNLPLSHFSHPHQLSSSRLQQWLNSCYHHLSSIAANLHDSSSSF